ncbi:hypothetical protein EDC02_5910 [Micromonospora sp. Llam0]|uniref:hypothetical protein n=1 Tax=Micromonospora sp. Llam0 TaxID=2485143 RepID=UPI000F46EC10|nr:hypothetical protein [Micromonospora sp. Llam0]ROO51046.1 hypothetical protein EDC02_5910 [Micromonospora sp. Llam0]
MSTDLPIIVLIVAIGLLILGGLGYATNAIVTASLPTPDDGPVVDVDQAGDATELLPAQQASIDTHIGTVDHTGADDEWAGVLHQAVTERARELPRVQRRLRDDWRELIADDIPQLQPTARYEGRHSDESIEMRIVPAGWMPPIGPHRIAAMVDSTAQMPAVRA